MTPYGIGVPIGSGPVGTTGGVVGVVTGGALAGGVDGGAVRAATGCGGGVTGGVTGAVAVLGSARGLLLALAVSPSSGAAVVVGVAAANVRSRESNESAVETLGDERSQAVNNRAAAIGAI